MQSTKRLLSLAILAVGAAACGHESTDQRLLGTWTLATDALDKVDAAHRARMEEKIADGFTMAVEFRADGTAIATEGRPSGKADADEAKWKLLSDEGERFVLQVTTPDGDTEELAGRWDGDLLLLSAGGQTLPLRKK